MEIVKLFTVLLIFNYQLIIFASAKYVQLAPVSNLEKQAVFMPAYISPEGQFIVENQPVSALQYYLNIQRLCLEFTALSGKFYINGRLVHKKEYQTAQLVHQYRIAEQEYLDQSNAFATKNFYQIKSKIDKLLQKEASSNKASAKGCIIS